MSDEEKSPQPSVLEQIEANMAELQALKQAELSKRTDEIGAEIGELTIEMRRYHNNSPEYQEMLKQQRELMRKLNS